MPPQSAARQEVGRFSADDTDEVAAPKGIKSLIATDIADSI